MKKLIVLALPFAALLLLGFGGGPSAHRPSTGGGGATGATGATGPAGVSDWAATVVAPTGIFYGGGGVIVGADAAFCALDGGAGDLRVADDLELGGGGVVAEIWGCEPLRLLQDTADGSDDGFVSINGGGAQDAARGAILFVHGNEHGTFPGVAIVEGGQVATGDVLVFTSHASASVLITSEQGATDNILDIDSSGLTYTGSAGDFAAFGPGIIIGTSGTAIADSYAGSATLDFPSTSATTADLAMTVTGAAVDDICTVSTSAAAMVTGAAFTCFFSAADTATVRLSAAGSNIDPASDVFYVRSFDP